MPRIKAYRKNYKKDDLVEAICGKLQAKKLKKKDLAELLQISTPSLSYKIAHRSFDYIELVDIFSFLGMSGDEIERLMTWQA